MSKGDQTQKAQQDGDRATLGAPTVIPIACDTTQWVPTRENGTPLFGPTGIVGSFLVVGACVGNELLVSATEQLPGQRRINDIFKGASEFCRSYYPGAPGQELHELIQVRSDNVGGGGNITITNPPAGSTTPSGLAAIGNIAYTALGRYISVTVGGSVGARGIGRASRVKLQIRAGGTIVWSDDNLLVTSGNTNDQTVASMQFAERLIPVVQGTAYTLEFQLTSDDTGSSGISAGGSVPWATVDTPLRVVLRSYRVRSTE